MNIVFYIAAAIAIASTFMVITGKNSVHALLYLIVSLLSIAVIFFMLGAHLIAALEVIIYAGAIMVLFIFVVMMLNLGKESEREESRLFNPAMWRGPAVLTVILFVEFMYVLVHNGVINFGGSQVTPQQVGISLFTTYVLGVELAAMLLMAGIIGAYHLGKRTKHVTHRFMKGDEV